MLLPVLTDDDDKKVNWSSRWAKDWILFCWTWTCCVEIDDDDDDDDANILVLFDVVLIFTSIKMEKIAKESNFNPLDFICEVSTSVWFVVDVVAVAAVKLLFGFTGNVDDVDEENEEPKEVILEELFRNLLLLLSS